MAGVVTMLAVPLIVITIIGGPLLYLYKTKQRKLEAITKIVELTGNVDAETMKML